MTLRENLETEEVEMRMGSMFAGVLAVVVGLAFTADLNAQQRGRIDRSGMRNGGPGAMGATNARVGGAESALRQWQRLELTDEQIAQLETLENEQVESFRAQQDRMRELQSQVRSGDITVEEVRDRMEAQRESLEANRESRSGRLEEILTEDQMQRLQRGNRAGIAGRRMQGRRMESARRGVQQGGVRGGVGVGSRMQTRGRIGAGVRTGRSVGPRGGGGVRRGGGDESFRDFGPERSRDSAPPVRRRDLD